MLVYPLCCAGIQPMAGHLHFLRRSCRGDARRPAGHTAARPSPQQVAPQSGLGSLQRQRQQWGEEAAERTAAGEAKKAAAHAARLEREAEAKKAVARAAEVAAGKAEAAAEAVAPPRLTLSAVARLWGVWYM